jgi:RimJ/RimL family protein N-acetyltransferase
MTDLMTVETSRLRLVAANASLLHLELEDRGRLYSTLDVDSPAEWPPPLNDDASCRYFLRTLEQDISSAGWACWYVIEKPHTLAGNCGFKGKPDAAGTVEVGYSIIPSLQRQGLASDAVAALLAWCGQRGAKKVIAETFSDLISSIRVMQKNGLVPDGSGSEPGVIRYSRVLTP